MGLAILGIPLGIVLLYLGSKWMVDGAKGIATLMGISSFVIGLTVLAFGSSAPEVFTTIASRDAPQLIVGNVVGSNIVNIGVAIGLSAILFPLSCSFNDIRIEIATMVLSSLVVMVMALTGMIGTLSGIILVTSILIFVYVTYRTKKGDNVDTSDEVTVDQPLWKCIALTILGLVILYLGSESFVAGARVVANVFGVSDLLVGLIVVAIGTSLPEICICLMAAYKHETGMAISNVMGSNIFNCLFVLGIGACITDIPMTDSVVTFNLPVMVLMTLLICAFIYRKDGIGRVASTMLLSTYVLYVVILALHPSLTI